MASKNKPAGKDRLEREQRERARIYQDRARLHEAQVSRNRRDNLIGGLAAGAIVLAAVIGQGVYFSAGPGAPKPKPTTSAPVQTPAPSGTNAPAPTPSASPTATK